METQRLYPAVINSERVCTQSCTVQGMPIPKGTKIYMPTYPAHINEEFFPQPFEFKPERFLKENSDKIIPYSYRPFGSGPRVCLGQRFAMVEMMIFMSKLMLKFKIVKVPNQTSLSYLNGDMSMNCFKEMIVKLEFRQ